MVRVQLSLTCRPHHHHHHLWANGICIFKKHSFPLRPRPDSGSESWTPCLRSGGEAGRPESRDPERTAHSLSLSRSLHTLYVIKCQALRRLRWRERKPTAGITSHTWRAHAPLEEGAQVRASAPYNDEICVLPQYVFYFIFPFFSQTVVSLRLISCPKLQRWKIYTLF